MAGAKAMSLRASFLLRYRPYPSNHWPNEGRQWRVQRDSRSCTGAILLVDST